MPVEDTQRVLMSKGFEREREASQRVLPKAVSTALGKLKWRMTGAWEPGCSVGPEKTG